MALFAARLRTLSHVNAVAAARAAGLLQFDKMFSVFSGTLPVALGRRHFGFFSILKQKLQEEFDKNEDFRNKVKTAQETDSMKKAAEAAAATKATAESAANFGAAAAEKVASKVGEAATAASAGFADSAVGQISSAIGSATIKAVDTAFTAGEAAVESAKKTTLGKIIDDSIHTDVAEGLFKPAEAPTNMAPIDTTTTTVALSSESPNGNNLTGNVKRKVSDIGNYLDDRLFGRNETVLTFNEVKRIDPYFNSIKFVKDFEKKTLPDFFVNYMSGNMDAIAEQCTEMAVRIGLNTAKFLQSQGLVLDLNVLRLYPVELDGARIEDGYAEIHLRFDVQEVRVITDKKGELKEGSYEDIMKTNYLCVLQRSLDDYNAKWKVHKLQALGGVKLLA